MPDCLEPHTNPYKRKPVLHWDIRTSGGLWVSVSRLSAKALDPEAEWPRVVRQLGRQFTPKVEAFLNSIEPLSTDEVAVLYNSFLHLGGGGKALAGLRHKDRIRDMLEQAVQVALDPNEQSQFRQVSQEMSGISYSSGSNRESTQAANEFGVRLGDVVFSRASDPVIVEWARLESGRLIREITESTRRNIAAIISDGIRDQLGVEGTARRIRDLIGLTSHQSATALRHRQELIDRGYGGIRLEQSYQRYLKTKVRERAELIANNEIHVAVATGQHSKALAVGRELKDWITVGDERVDPNICRPNEAMGKIPINTEFPNSSSQTTPGHIRCRCTNNYYGGNRAMVERELRNPRRVAPATTAPRPKPPKPVAPAAWKKTDFQNLSKTLFDSVDATGLPYQAEDRFYQVWNATVKMSPQDFFGKLMEGVAPKGGALTLNYNNFAQSFKYQYNNVSEGLSFTRIINFETMVVDHQYFSIVEGAQGGGIGKRLLGNSMELYEKIGLKRITVHANINVGGYAWAKYGFSPEEKEWKSLRTEILDNADFLKNQDVKIAIQKVLNEGRNNPKTLWVISDMTAKDTGEPKLSIGKQLLLKEDWYGHLDLSDPEAMKRFKAYVNK